MGSLQPEEEGTLKMNSIRPVLFLTVPLLSLSLGCGASTVAEPATTTDETRTDVSTHAPSDAEAPDEETSNVDLAAGGEELVVAGGCFWCTEAVFDQLRGVKNVVSGYAGGTAETADYRTVSDGLTAHAESIRITYDPDVVSEESLLRVFFLAAHDPTQVNRQGPDLGRQYRSTIFYTSDEQKRRAESMIDQLNKSGQFDSKIATTLEPLKGFYPAEKYHQDYVIHHPDDRYVEANALPKIAKVRKLFPDLVRQ